ncbi:MBL fold metallo-hydrolase [Herbiconiux sp. P17]|uniref:MBL fold metallo-hydrolase n=1 Tax=Herbiconiux wuyangfengii TaxID=3342794 RepID=UPI0035B7E1D0
MTASDGIVVRSRAQADAWRARTPPEPEHVADDVWAVASPIPGGAIPHTLTYLLAADDGSVAIIDPGWDSDENLASLTASLARISRTVADVSTVLATHFHPDHLGLAERLRATSGCRVVLSGEERRVLAQETDPHRHDRVEYARVLHAWGVPDARRTELVENFDRPAYIDDLEPDLLIAHGAVLELPGHRLRVVGTPGHTSGHVCFHDEARSLLYTGDHVLPEIYSGVGIGTLPGRNALADYLESLDRVAALTHLQALPGHEFRFDGLQERTAQIAAHHLRRTAEVAALTDRLGDAAIWNYAELLTWTGGWARLDGFHLHSALTQTEMHLGLVRSGAAAPLLARR